MRSCFQIALVCCLPAMAMANEPDTAKENKTNTGTPVSLSVVAAAPENAPSAADAKTAAQPARLIGQTARIQLVVTATLDSQQQRDWTHSVKYRAEPAGIVEISQTGLVTPLANGAVRVDASSGGLTGTANLIVERFDNSPRINFTNQIVPILTKLGCNGGGCHGKSGGQNGFALSLLGFEAEDDYTYLVHEARGRRVFPAAPDRSLLLQKAIGSLPHGGGKRMQRDSDEYRQVRQWIEQGLPFGEANDPTLERISVFPKQRRMAASGQQQLKVTAHFSDGSIQDVTRQAQFTPNNTEMAAASETGLVQLREQPGVVAVMVRYQGQVDAFLATLPLGKSIESLPPERNFVDSHVFAQWQELGLPPSDVCDDATFLRRTTLDIAGRLPTLEEAQRFSTNSNSSKRSQLVDRLLETSDYADYFAQKWAAILRNRVQQNIPRDGNILFHDWLRTELLNNTPYDQLVSNIVTASGDVRNNPAVNWHRHLKTMDEKVEDTAQVFLGQRIQCAKCHHHPFEKWSQQDYWGLAAFYSNVREKNGLQVLVQRAKSQARNPRTNQMVQPTRLGGPAFELTVDDDARLALVNWMTAKDNPFFARTLVNRYWKHFLGRGIVDPEDDMRVTNPPSNPELLDALAQHFAANDFDLKDLIRTICNSTTYQLSSTPGDFNAADQQSYSKFYPRRLPAEVVLDSIDHLLGTSSNFNGLPGGTKATQIPDHGSVRSVFLDSFGRPGGSSACECERSGDMSMSVSLQLLNSDEIHNKINSSRARQLANDKERDAAEKIAELYLRAFSRPPTGPESQSMLRYIASIRENKQRQPHEAYEDILWTLINTKEFLFNH